MRLPLDGSPKISTEYMEPGTGSLGKHLGVDYAIPTGTPVYAPGQGVVTQVSEGSVGGKMIELRIGAYLWRFLHLSQQLVHVGQGISEGQMIAKSGATGQVSGPHLHVDTRLDGNAWNASLSNYRDPRSFLGLDMPSIGSWIQLMPQDTRTTFRVGTANEAGKIRVIDDTFKYLVRGYDEKFPGRIIINSASAGGNGVGLALYYLNGQRIPGWKKV